MYKSHAGYHGVPTVGNGLFPQTARNSCPDIASVDPVPSKIVVTLHGSTMSICFPVLPLIMIPGNAPAAVGFPIEPMQMVWS